MALITMWLLGMHAVAGGLRAIDIVRSPLSESLASFDSDDLGDAAQRAFVRGVNNHAETALPLGVAQLLLGTLLAVVSARALLWRKGSRSLALQLLMANALLAVIGYVLHDPIRRSVVEALVAFLARHPPAEAPPSEYVELARTNLRWGFRLWLTAQLSGFTFAGIMLLRRPGRELFAGANGSDSNRNP